MDRAVETKAERLTRLSAWHCGETALHYLRRVLDVIDSAYTAHWKSERLHQIEVPIVAWRMFRGPVEVICETLGLEIIRRDSTSAHTVFLEVRRPQSAGTGGVPSNHRRVRP